MIETAPNVHYPKLPEASVGLRSYVLVACVAGASLGLELIQTRILSFLYYNHVAYLTVTVALLGFGISGVFVSLFASRSEDPERMISLLAGGFVISSFACLAVVSRIPGMFPHASRPQHSSSYPTWHWCYRFCFLEPSLDGYS